MRKTLCYMLLALFATLATAQDIEFRMGGKTNKKAYIGKIIKIAEGTQEGQLLIVQPSLKSVFAGGFTPNVIKDVKVRLCDMEWKDSKSIVIPDSKKFLPLEAFRTNDRFHVVLYSTKDNQLVVRHVTLDAQSLDILADQAILTEPLQKKDESWTWMVASPDRQHYGIVCAVWGKEQSHATAMLFDHEMNQLWQQPLAYSNVQQVIVSNSGTIATLQMGMVEDNKELTAFRANIATAEGERHGEYILDADVSDIALLNTEGNRLLAVALEGEGGYGLLRMGALGSRKYTGLWSLVFDLDKQAIATTNRHPFTDLDLTTLSNEDAGEWTSRRSVYFVDKLDDCTTPQGGAVLYQHRWSEETRDMKGRNRSETVYSKGILVVQANMQGELTISPLPQNNQNASWPDMGAELLAHGGLIYVVTNESKDETDIYTPNRHAMRSKSLFMANAALAVYWFTPDGQGAKKVVERDRKALLCSPLMAGSDNRYYFLTKSIMPNISMLKLPSAQ